jgi:hypothetical protein
VDTFSNEWDKAELIQIAIYGIPATFTPYATGQPQTICGIIAPPPFEEDVLPNSVTGTALVHFHIRYSDITPSPVEGDAITLDGVVYDLFKIDVNVVGGARLRLRKRSA